MRMKLIERREEAPGVETFIFEPSEPVSWKAGQFLHYVLHHEPTDERGSDRWFTVSAAPFEGKPHITTRFIKDAAAGQQSSFKKALRDLQVGSEAMEVSDVDGDFTVEDPVGEYVFIAGGIGVTPFRSILKQLDHEGVPINASLLYGNRDENIPFKAELDELAARQPGFKVRYLAGTRLDAVAVQAAVPDMSKPIFYISGPEPMVEALHTELKGLGVPAERLKGDWFPGYPAD